MPRLSRSPVKSPHARKNTLGLLRLSICALCVRASAAPARIPTTYATPHLSIRNRYPLYLGTLRAAAAAPEYGPAKGTLVIVGGGNHEGTGIMEKFIEIAGGPDKKFVIVPTAGGNRGQDGDAHRLQGSRVVASWMQRGVKNVKMLHTHDPKVADTEAFVKDLRDANAVWFNGGRQWNIVDSYANTLTYREFHKVLERGGVIGGSSAGATIQGHYLVRGDTSGPERDDDRRSRSTRRLRLPPQSRRSTSTSTRATAGTI